MFCTWNLLKQDVITYIAEQTIAEFVEENKKQQKPPYEGLAEFKLGATR
jgi:predicted transcriptional regulator